MQKKISNKLKWIKAEMVRVELNPDQAVLSCCSSTGRGVSYVGTGSSSQCSGACTVSYEGDANFS
ncbi:MAG: hypothetical protein PHP69_07455 [Candidatus Omnitrophica bacterium]|nr:hypothetical protein [Candidatus Omnitrophota bacterium]MDD5081340.1 hypothetical protein [Candidatus Omnitrophota bacterium]